MTEHMSTKDYREQIIKPANADVDNFEAALTAARNLVKKKGEKVAQHVATEHEIQTAILQRLALMNKAFFWRENSGLVKVGEPGAERFFRAGIQGIADIMGLYRGVPIAIEVKRPGKKPSIDQIAFKQRFEQCGGVYLICIDASQVASQITEAISVRKV